ncbi:protein TolQ [Fangia hongkongensis]|uniref:protein TolQ n=1 Tax=Fangia hongkongensis TaxID=270495 RepID=UPI00038292F2|nr:protein TolQ [Fangia hongkongensis]MBK2124111.1 protein TolQ [Fangia hongkongensis]
MANNLSFWHLIANADIVVQLIMLILVVGSVWSWAIMIQRYQVTKQAKLEAKRFAREFWSSGNISKIYQKLSANKTQVKGMSYLFSCGFREFLRLRKQGNLHGDVVLEGVERSMRVAMMQESEKLEHQISLLGTIGSIAPYVGLLGTVWGIMASFTALGGVEQATLSMVAPHIAEALIATALGLFVAIPAVVGYNRFSKSVDAVLLEYENFQDELCTLLYREAYKPQSESTNA